MKVDLLFSRNKKCGSKLIAWASALLVKDLEKVPSHVAVLLDDNFVIEAVLHGGVRMLPFSQWLQINELCYRIPGGEKSSEEVAKEYESCWGKSYDWLGLCFFGLCFIKHLLFGTPFPKENAWQKDDAFFCIEFAAGLSNYKKFDMTTPAKMCSDLLKGN